MDDHTSTPSAAADKPPKVRRWPRRVAIGLAITGVVVGGTAWYLGRETTLQMIAERVARSTGGKLTLTGVRGSIYGAMHIDRIVWRTDEQLAIATNIDLEWSPRQLLSRGIEVNKLHAADLRLETLKESEEKTTMPASLAPPFKIALDDARLAKATFVNKGASTEITNIRMRLLGDKVQWQLRDAAATTPWGQVAADGQIGSQKPFKLAANASLSQGKVGPGATPAALTLRAGGDLNVTTLDATGNAGRAGGEARMTLSPFAEIPLRTMDLKARNIDPGFFNPSLPTADLSLTIAAKLDDARAISGNVNLVNDGPAGTIDQQRLPLRAFRGQLGGNLDAMRISDVLLDFGAAGRFTGSGSVQRGGDKDNVKEQSDEGLGTANFALHTDSFDLKGIHGSMKPTKIAGDIAVANVGKVQTLDVRLVESGLRLTAKAKLEDNVVDVQDARLAAGKGTVVVNGNMKLDGDKDFKVSANASRFNPAALGDYPQADINALVNASGVLAPTWRVNTDFALRPSRLFDQPLSGKGKLMADAKHVSGVDASLALGQNTVNLNGAFGAPGERMAWRVEGRNLATLKSDLYGAVSANGVVTGTMANPRTTFNADANGLGWVAAQRKANNSNLHVSGEAWLAGADGARFVEAKGSGNMARFNPAAFGSPLPGSINGAFDASGRSGADWRGALNLRLAESTLAKSPFWGHARLAADKRHVSGADVDLHIGANVLAAKGSFGAGGDRLDWRIDAPQLAALGPDFGGALRGAGSVSGTMQTPSLAANLEGQNLRLLGTHNVKSLRANANLGSGRGGADPLVADIQVAEYSNGDTRIAAASLQSSGTRASHTLRAAARSDDFDAFTEVRGGWSGNAWAGTLAALQNKGRYAMTLAQPVPLRIGVAPGAGVAGLAKPESLAFNGALIRLPSGTVRIDTLTKTGSRWNSRGAAAGVPLNYLGQFSEALRDNVQGNLTLGADWSLDMRMVTGGAPALAGSVHVFREGGDALVGANTPVALGLRTFDVRADVQGSSLRTQLALDGARTGTARVDGTVQMIGGKVNRDSPLRMTANADMASIAWLAPLAGQRDLELGGSMKLAITAGGTIGTPSLNGTVNGDAIAVRWPEQGVRLQGGQLRAQLAGDRLVLQRLYLQGRTGSATADGSIRFGDTPAMQLNLVADKLEALSRPDRTVIVSGNAALVRDATRFSLEGRFKADRALIEFAPQGRPTISDDVIVLGRGKPMPPQKKEKEVPLMIDLAADLGDNFHLRGLGIDAMLEGSARVRMTGNAAPRVNGTIRVASGNYAAYGQKLAIDRGVITFAGPYDNPTLDVLAVRKQPEGTQLSETNVEAGVQVRGTARAPQAKLVSTPNVPDSEKLSWLVLGHGMEGTSGNEKDVLSAAAGALLGGKGGTGGIQSKLANSLGVDELGIGQGRNGDAEGLANTVVTIGKRISSRAYISFEQGASSASSLVNLRYKLTPKFTLQFQAGTNTALDVLYSWAWD
ncbi:MULTISPECIES: translocation/assembly module TamB domain-containing protein [unclassified Massilia]|uniref:translocation/assembly module TamB domain-containing protein n=1 Tax=unclassified Massilia TaxID=2609279 RepID=UPI001787332A|nr:MULTISPECIES: translocation/assembly module TamB domain-containing protein [unclassified Massilia]MBD8529646.1 translocation/assembly module TamB domain-containing protein [Massilia sp. CFBP 13647]MBD8673267.1 translocation/assembly module TamB domain-containing protein [Massilia sp. CFBP 13721]